MGKYCYVCKEGFKANMYHKFPSKGDVRKKWLDAFGFEEDDIFKQICVCSKHFETDCYHVPNELTGKKFLKKGSIPTLFLKGKKTQGKSLTRKLELDAQSSNNAVPSTSKNVTGISNIEKISVEKSNMDKENLSPNMEISSTEHLKMEILFTENSDMEVVVEDTSTENLNLEIISTKNSDMEVVADTSSIVDNVSDEFGLSTPKRQKRWRPAYYSQVGMEHGFDTPRRARQNFALVASKVNTLRKKISSLNRRNRLLRAKVKNLDSFLNHLKSKNLISEEAHLTIQVTTPDTVKDIIQRILTSKNVKISPQLRAFALTLNFYSSEAYNYVRKQLKNLLPHERTLSRWYQVIDGDVGFTKQSFESIKSKVSEGAVLINLAIDEMSIRENVFWDGKKWYGYVDLGNQGSHSDEGMATAKNACFYGCMYESKLESAKERANLLNKCLLMLEETGAACRSVTFDGAAVNIRMCEILKCIFDYPSRCFRPWFAHPVCKEKVFVFWDACHMLKLIRNSFGTKKVFKIANQQIKWAHIENLHKLQTEEGLNCGNKLKKRHINWQAEKMNVRLAAQLLSKSVADSLKYCELTNLIGCEGANITAKFC